MTRLLLLATAALAVAGCAKHEATPANEAAANITTVDANAMPPDANITDIPEDEGGAPAEAETNAK